MTVALHQSDCPELELVARGKCAMSIELTTIVCCSWQQILSAFDVIMKTPLDKVKS